VGNGLKMHFLSCHFNLLRNLTGHSYNRGMQVEILPNTATAECPCVGHCTTALGDDVCRSCLRTFEEVTRWPELTDEERIQINRRIAELSSPP
jgi:hypothetical protein